MARVALSRVARSCWLPSLGVHAASARPEGALWSGDTPSKSPPPPPLLLSLPGRCARPRKPGRPAPRAPAPAPAPRRSPARLPTGVRLQETARSQLRAWPPDAPQTTRRFSQTTRWAPAAAAESAVPGRSLGHLRTDGVGGVDRPWGPGPGQQWRASGSPGPEKWAAGRRGP